MPDNSADRKSIRAREKAAKVNDELRATVIREIMSTTTGRMWMWDHLAECSIFHQTFTSDPLTTAFNEGRRSIGLSVMADILRTCPDQYITAMRESHDRDTLIEQRSGPISNGGNPGPVDDGDAGGEAAGTGEPEAERPDELDHSIIGVDAEVRPNAASRPYRHLNN